MLFLVNIVRIVVTKLNDDSHQHGPGNQEGTHMRKALRATLILFPLLGITHLLFFINPKDGTHDKLYIIFNATMQSSQVKMHNGLKSIPKEHTIYLPKIQQTKIAVTKI